MIYSIRKTNFFLEKKINLANNKSIQYAFHFSEMPLQFVQSMNSPANGSPPLQNYFVSETAVQLDLRMSKVFSMYIAK